MNTPLQTAEEIRAFLVSLQREDMSEDARHALAKDTQYIEKCLSILSRADKEAIDSLWHEVQYLSRFFGGDYAKGNDQRRLAELSDRLHQSLLNQVVMDRAK